MTMAAVLPASAETQGAADGAPSLHGVLPWRETHRSGLKILLVSPRNEERWTVPAGPPVGDRAPFMSAALHAFEEAGIIGEIDTLPLDDYPCADSAGDGGASQRRVRLFAMKVRGTLSQWKRQDERRRRWFSPQEAAERTGDAGLCEPIRILTERWRPASVLP